MTSSASSGTRAGWTWPQAWARPGFFERHGFSAIEGQAVSPEVYAELLRSYDEGVAEFLDLERVKPNTLGNTRMLRIL